MFDNPYLSVNVYEMTEKWEPKLSQDIKLVECEKEYLLKMMSSTSASYFPNVLCFKDKNKISMTRNWFGQTFKNPFIVIESCNPKFYKGTCKSEEEIESFMEDNVFYYGNQETLVNKNVYSYSPDIDFDYSLDGTVNTYYPL